MHELSLTKHLISMEIVGIILVAGFYFGKLINKIKLPQIIGFMLLGVILGPSLVNLVDHEIQLKLGFLTELALGFVALSIGLELDLKDLKKQGSAIIFIILAESFGAFFLVFFSCWWITDNLPMALIFAGIAPASAPAGTVAVIQQYRAKGPLTKALYAVVGFDDGLCIIIFGFSAALARSILLAEAGNGSSSILASMITPTIEVILSLLVGIVIALIFTLLSRGLNNATDTLIHVFAFVLLATGISVHFHLSLILTNMIFGFFVINSGNHKTVIRIKTTLPIVMQVLFILFFTLAGSNLHIGAASSLGALGIVYVLSRSAGLILGSRLGAWIGNASENIKKYIGFGILSQAGVAIGLSLIVSHEFKGIGKIESVIDGKTITAGDLIGSVVLTSVTVTCIFFEIIGPILTHYALKKANEIK